MNLVKKFLGWGGEQPAEVDPFSNFKAEAKPYQIKGENAKIPLFASSFVRIIGYAPGASDCHIHVKNALGSRAKDEPEEYFFPVSSGMNLRRYFEKDGPNEKLVFLFNLDKNNTISLEFDNEAGDLTDGYVFCDLLCKLIYENFHGFSYKKAESDDDYNLFCKEIQAPVKSKPKPQQIINVSLGSEKELNNLANQFNEKLNIDRVPKEINNQVKPIQRSQEQNDVFTNIGALIVKFSQEKDTLLVNSGRYCTVDDYRNENVVNSAVIFLLKDVGNFNFTFYVINDKGGDIYKKSINSELNYDVNITENTFKWLDFSKGLPVILLVRFDSSVATMNLKFLIAKCVVEANRRDSFQNIFKKEESWGDKYLAGDQKFDKKLIDEYEDVDDLSYEGSYNSQTEKLEADDTKFTQARALDRTFVTSGCNISVFKDNDKKSLEFICNLPPVKDFRGKELNPSQVILQEEDTKLILLDRTENKQLYYMDLEKGKIVSEMYADEGRINTFLNISPYTKHGELTHNPLLIANSEKHIFQLDPRLKPELSCVKKKIYSTNNGFTSIASCEQGHFALGSDTGDIRLYKEVGKNAANLYPGLGDPIISLDSSKDGRWLLATCKNYILLVPTFSENKNGYTTSLGSAENKPIPKKLIILPEDIAYLKLRDFTFSPAKFDDNEKEKEKYIVSGFENYIVFWTMRHVMKGELDKYELKKINDKINQNEFKFNHDDSMVVALPRQVMIQKTIRKNK